MSRKTIQSIVGAFAGGAIGALVGLQIGFGPAWLGLIVSALVGGLIGWIVVDAQKFWAGMVAVWQDLRIRAPRFRPKTVHTPLERKETLWTYAALAAAFGGVFFLIYVALELLIHLGDPKTVLFQGSIFEKWALWQKLLVPYLLSAGVSAVTIVLGLCRIWLFGVPRRAYATEDELKDFIETSKLIILLCNAIVLPFTLVWLFFASLIPWLWKYLVALYRITVSSYRIATMVGGSVGGVVGYLVGEPLVGGALGVAAWFVLAAIPDSPSKSATS